MKDTKEKGAKEEKDEIYEEISSVFFHILHVLRVLHGNFIRGVENA
jgi:hypothetical protein